jgi:hypothetical protein
LDSHKGPLEGIQPAVANAQNVIDKVDFAEFCFLRGIGRGTASFLLETFEGTGFGYESVTHGQRISATL